MGMKLDLNSSRKERRLRVSESRALRRIFVPKREGVIGDFRELHSDDLNS
jgi:hypothetical protein